MAAPGDEATLFPKAVSFLQKYNSQRSLVKIMRGSRKRFNQVLHRGRTFLTSLPVGDAPSDPVAAANWNLASQTGDPEPVWVYKVTAPDIKLELGRPLCPPGREVLLEAANCCRTVVFVACACAWDPSRSAPLLITSAGLGGECEVLRLRAVPGEYRAPPHSVFNPLVLAYESSRDGQLLLPPGEARLDGSRAYQHVWLQAQVKAPDGQEHEVCLDPTAAQFGLADLEVWHAVSPGVGDRYIPSKSFLSLPTNREESMFWLQRELQG